MMSPFLWLWCLLGAYAVGSVPFGYLVSRGHGIDIRQHGSRNIGATNVSRVLGRPWGTLCFALDFLKGLVPVLAALWLARTGGHGAAGGTAVAAAAGAVAGHVWPISLGFRGGKGVATTIGALLALAPLPVLAALVLWLLVFKLSRYVSLASIAAVALMPLAAAAMEYGGLPGILVLVATGRELVLLLMFVLAALVILRHRGNISRLLNGTENRFPRRGESRAVPTAGITP